MSRTSRTVCVSPADFGLNDQGLLRLKKACGFVPTEGGLVLSVSPLPDCDEDALGHLYCDSEGALRSAPLEKIQRLSASNTVRTFVDDATSIDLRETIFCGADTSVTVDRSGTCNRARFEVQRGILWDVEASAGADYRIVVRSRLRTSDEEGEEEAYDETLVHREFNADTGRIYREMYVPESHFLPRSSVRVYDLQACIEVLTGTVTLRRLGTMVSGYSLPLPQ